MNHSADQVQDMSDDRTQAVKTIDRFERAIRAGDLNMEYITARKEVLALATHAGAAAAEPSDGDILRAAQANGASVVWEGDGAGVHFTTASWASFCASLRATAPLAALTSAPAVPEATHQLLTADDWKKLESLRPIVDGGPDCQIAIHAPLVWKLIETADALNGVQPGERGEG